MLKICGEPKKTRTGQYATDEQTLASLASDHEIVQKLLEHRAAAKLKSTYADALPAAIWPKTGRVHTTYSQLGAATGRLSSNDPNLQNIPTRTDEGREIRRGFVAAPGHIFIAADAADEPDVGTEPPRRDRLVRAFPAGDPLVRGRRQRLAALRAEQAS